MDRPNILGTTKERIKKMNKGSVIVATDFADIADAAKMGVTLSRLEDEGIIRRIFRGVYEYPEYNDFLKEYVEPSPDKVAHALSRKFGWTIVPCGDTALNILKLSMQVPAIWLYGSDGNYKEYTYGNTTIKFKRTTNKEISKISYKTALVIQALKALGKDNITPDIITKIQSMTTAEEKKTMLNDAKYATSWIYNTIKKICREKE